MVTNQKKTGRVGRGHSSLSASLTLAWGSLWPSTIAPTTDWCTLEMNQTRAPSLNWISRGSKLWGMPEHFKISWIQSIYVYIHIYIITYIYIYYIYIYYIYILYILYILYYIYIYYILYIYYIYIILYYIYIYIIYICNICNISFWPWWLQYSCAAKNDKTEDFNQNGSYWSPFLLQQPLRSQPGIGIPAVVTQEGAEASPATGTAAGQGAVGAPVFFQRLSRGSRQICGECLNAEVLGGSKKRPAEGSPLEQWSLRDLWDHLRDWSRSMIYVQQSCR